LGNRFALFHLNKVMQEYIINVSKVEELQTISNIDELDSIFSRAKGTIVNGESVILVRNNTRFDELTTLEELSEYKKRVYKYL